ncbi:MAG TPA: hypothetical protein DD490_18275 [Acidobacteria bacterium]|nr:hypothetical protein [Acidobacteriota bacterium]
MGDGSQQGPYSSLMSSRGSGRGGGGRTGAQQGGSLRQMGGVGMLQRHATEMGLSEEQLDRLDALRTRHELEKIDLQAALLKAKVLQRAKARDLSTPEPEVMQAIEDLCRAECELRKMRYRHLKAAHGVLNPDQYEKVRRFHRRQTQDRLDAVRAGRES